MVKTTTDIESLVDTMTRVTREITYITYEAANFVTCERKGNDQWLNSQVCCGLVCLEAYAPAWTTRSYLLHTTYLLQSSESS